MPYTMKAMSYSVCFMQRVYCSLLIIVYGIGNNIQLDFYHLSKVQFKHTKP